MRPRAGGREARPAAAAGRAPRLGEWPAGAPRPGAAGNPQSGGPQSAPGDDGAPAGSGAASSARPRPGVGRPHPAPVAGWSPWTELDLGLGAAPGACGANMWQGVTPAAAPKRHASAARDARIRWSARDRRPGLARGLAVGRRARTRAAGCLAAGAPPVAVGRREAPEGAQSHLDVPMAQADPARVGVPLQVRRRPAPARPTTRRRGLGEAPAAPRARWPRPPPWRPPSTGCGARVQVQKGTRPDDALVVDPPPGLHATARARILTDRRNSGGRPGAPGPLGSSDPTSSAAPWAPGEMKEGGCLPDRAGHPRPGLPREDRRAADVGRQAQAYLYTVAQGHDHPAIRDAAHRPLTMSCPAEAGPRPPRARRGRAPPKAPERTGKRSLVTLARRPPGAMFGGGNRATSPLEPAEYYPLAVGNSWTYSPTRSATTANPPSPSSQDFGIGPVDVHKSCFGRTPTAPGRSATSSASRWSGEDRTSVVSVMVSTPRSSTLTSRSLHWRGLDHCLTVETTNR